MLLSRTGRFQYDPCGFALHLDGLMKQGQEQCETQSWAWWSKAVVLGAKAVFSGRIRAQIVCDRIFSAKFFGVKTNVLCALKKLYSLDDEQHACKNRIASIYLQAPWKSL